MKIAIVWVDRAQARLIHFSQDKMERKNFWAIRQEERELFELAAKELIACDRLLIAGPGVAKFHFQAFLQEQYPQISRKISALENMSDPSDTGLAALALRSLERLPA